MVRFVCMMLLGILLAGCEPSPPPPQAPHQGIKIAVTLDDLPLSSQASVEKLVSALKQHHVPAPHAFITGSYVYQPGADQQAKLAILDYWHQQGFPLGNHGFNHVAIKRFNSLQDAQKNAEMNEQILSSVYARSGRSDPLTYRYTFLDEGFNNDVGKGFRGYLEERGYKIAHVSLNVSDWVWAEKYQACAAQQDMAAMQQLRTAFVDYAMGVLQSRREASSMLLQRDINHILLLHANEFMGDVLPQLLTALTDAGVTFVPLAEAMADPLYQEYQYRLLPKQSDILNKKAVMAKQYAFATPTQPRYPQSFAQLCL